MRLLGLVSGRVLPGFNLFGGLLYFFGPRESVEFHPGFDPRKSVEGVQVCFEITEARLRRHLTECRIAGGVAGGVLRTPHILFGFVSARVFDLV